MQLNLITLSTRVLERLTLIFLTGILCFITAAAHAATCERLAHLVLPDTTITLAKSETAETYKPGTMKLQGPALTNLPAFCRVAAEMRPTPDSLIKFEVWMPMSGWNGKFMGVGNGGWSGEIWYPFMGMALRDKYATASTDTGHEGSIEDASFALGHPEKVVDFAHRAVHEMTVKAKTIIAAYYGDTAKFSYWFGCSSGGKQGLKEAQLFPKDYDGIFAGAPANYWTHLMASGVWIWQANHKGNVELLSQNKLNILHSAALDACESKDGVIGDPQNCRFDPGIVQCKGEAKANCLTGTEVEAAKRIYAGPKNPRTGEQTFPGLEPGSELNWGAFGSAADPPIVASYFRYLIFKDAAWKAEQLNFDSDIALADKMDTGLIGAIDPNLKEFFAHSGKLILYHGWADGTISPRNTITYYKDVSRANGAAAEDSVRLFLAPGMGHCSGLLAPSGLDTMEALTDWVEHDKEPKMLIAFPAQNAPMATHGPDRPRPLCAFPQTAKYKGAGGTDDAANFECTRE